MVRLVEEGIHARQSVPSPAAARRTYRAIEPVIRARLLQLFGVTHVGAPSAARDQESAARERQNRPAAQGQEKFAVADLERAEAASDEIAHIGRPEQRVQADLGLKVSVETVTVIDRNAGAARKQASQLAARLPTTGTKSKV